MNLPNFIRSQVTSQSLKITNYYQLGYFLFGPPILEFCRRLIVRTINDGNLDYLLFISREGFLLQKVYNLLTKQLLNAQHIDNSYFLASRRSITIINIRDMSDIPCLLKYKYTGTLSDLLKFRFGINDTDFTTFNIKLPQDVNLALPKILLNYGSQIIDNATFERNNYMKYINTVLTNVNTKSKIVGVVDFGYSGTIQENLQKLLNCHLRGYYFVTNTNNATDSTGLMVNRSTKVKTTSNIYKYNLLFESILTSDKGQLLHFDSNGKPVYATPEHDYSIIEQIHHGIVNFVYNIVSTCKKEFLTSELSETLINVWLNKFVRNPSSISKNVITVFEFNDNYCNSFKGNALQAYSRV